MVEICSIRENDGEFEGMTITPKQYRSFFTDGDEIIYDETFSKVDYEDYEHFAGVIGKFDPYVFLLSTPVKIDKMNKENLMAVWEGVK